jgi:hypothetical protein
MEDNLNIISNPIDKVNLEYLMNRTQYKKYVSKTDPKKHFENEIFLSKIKKYKNRIFDLTETLISNPEEPITNDVNDIFYQYVKTLIKHFEIKDMENDDNDTLFEKIDDVSIDRVDNDEKYDDKEDLLENKVKSFWGKNRVIKSQVLLPYSFSSKKL